MRANDTPWKVFTEVAALAEKSEAAPPEDAHALSLYNILRGQPADDLVVEDAYAIFTSPYRHVMDALSLCLAKDVDVETSLELRPGVYAVYRKLFFDRSVFSSVFEMRLYVQRLAVSDEDREVYALAMQEGPLRLLDRYRVGPRPQVDPQIVLEDMLGEAHSRAFEHRGRPITSRVASESFKWGRAAATTALAMKQSATSNRMASALEQLEFALTSDDQTKAPEDLGLNPNDIVKG